MHPSTTSVYPQKRCIQVISFSNIQNLARKKLQGVINTILTSSYFLKFQHLSCLEGLYFGKYMPIGSGDVIGGSLNRKKPKQDQHNLHWNQ